MSAKLLPCVEIEPPVAAGAAVIWLHGLGADGHDFEPIVPQLGLPDSAAVRFVFPHAPSIPVSLNAGMVMPAWYDIRDLDLRGRGHDEAGIRRSCDQVRALIAREIERGVESERIVLAGFSQGGAIALHVALRHPDKLAGVVALSTYLLAEDALAGELSAANRRLPIFQAHGLQDPMVPFERGLRARDRLLELGLPVEWHTYRMQHQVCFQEIQDIGAWLRKRLGA